VIDYLVSVLTVGAIGSIIALGLNVRWGWAGDFDLSYYAFVAVGAYMGGVIVIGPSPQQVDQSWMLGLHQNFVVGLVVAAVSSTAVSIVVGAVALRQLRSDYFAIVTLAFALIAAAVISVQNTNLFNGQSGIYTIPQPLSDKFDYFSYGYFYLGFVAIFLLVVYAVLELIYRSPFGRTLRIIREDEIAAEAFGRNVYRAKLKAFAIGGAVAGVGGFLFATYLTAWDPATWSPFEAILLYTAIFLGGQANSRGVIVGVFVALVALPETTRFLPNIPGHPNLYPELHNVMQMLLLLAVLRWRPQGIFPEMRFLDRFTSGRLASVDKPKAAARG
jgi:branched-chain amino acid transport system permease protein